MVMKALPIVLVCLFLVIPLSLSLEMTSLLKRNDCGVKFEDNGVCVCNNHSKYRPLHCHNRHSLEIQPCYCVYYDAGLNLSAVGHCFFTCFSNTRIKIANASGFNNDMCNGFYTTNRNGHFCGSCDKDHGLAVYSYHYISCIPCKDTSYKNWLKYFAVALLPLTAFYIIALLLKFNVTSSSLGGIVMVIQCVSSPLYMNIIGSQMILHFTNIKSHSLSIVIKTILTICCMTNLDFFRFVHPPFCLHPKANILHILSLDYIVALYPFLLILITYVLVTLYDRNYRLLVWIWKPFKWCIYHYSKKWNIRSSLVEIFATFFLLSYIKIFGVSLNLLLMTRTYDITGRVLKKNYLLYNANIEYFGSEHLPFAVLAIFVITVFVLLPFLLLLLYPCCCFQRCLNYFGLRCQTLHIFMDAFQGSYRTEPRDYRYFSAYYLLLRMVISIQVQIFYSGFIFYTSAVLAIIFAAVLMAAKPFKVDSHNNTDSILIMLMAGYFSSYAISDFQTMLGNYHESDMAGKFAVIFGMLLILYFVLLVSWKLIGSKVKSIARKCRQAWGSSGRHTPEYTRSIETFDRDLPINEIAERKNYPPLLGRQEPTY